MHATRNKIKNIYSVKKNTKRENKLGRFLDCFEGRKIRRKIGRKVYFPLLL